MIPPRSSKTRSPLDPIHPSQFGRKQPTGTRDLIAGGVLIGFGLIMMVTIPSGTDADALVSSTIPVTVHWVCAVVGIFGGALLLARWVDRSDRW